MVSRTLWKFLTWQWKQNPCKGLCVASITIWSFQAHIVTICNIAPVCVSILDWGNNCLYRGKCYIWQPLGHDSMLHIAYCGAIFHPYKICYGEESQWLGYWLQLQKQSDTTLLQFPIKSHDKYILSFLCATRKTPTMPPDTHNLCTQEPIGETYVSCIYSTCQRIENWLQWIYRHAAEVRKVPMNTVQVVTVQTAKCMEEKKRSAMSF